MSETIIPNTAMSRRGLLGAFGAGTLAVAGAGLLPRAARAEDDKLAKEIQRLLGDRKATEGKVSLKLPQIAENGNTVPVTVEVESAMGADAYCKKIHVIASGNPAPTVATFELTPSCGQASVSTRMRLAKTQDIVALAEMSDGSVFSGKQEIKVTIGGCGG